ncbi:uncharacterized protein LOC113240241 [Hyposmocoma kahamanoa]|uniref:uncharacterized protein LOC113240241 n=1 Tax=Hyposmocoma kahamanoa TaxID=1477025 RepID=UPI000E6D7C29|nr:uncharacterized protein LOC113240241 [Hyposmocoma kahamanoa]
MAANQQLYLLELLIDQVSIFPAADEEPQAPNNKFIILVNFGPKYKFIIKESFLLDNLERKDDIQESDQTGRAKWTRRIRVGRSYLFPSYPDLVINELSKFPLEIEMWNDDQTENQIFVAFGKVLWSNEFYEFLQDTSHTHNLYYPLTIKSSAALSAECCCRMCAEITFIMRISPLGTSVITEFQELATDPHYFVFRTNKSPMFIKCARIEGDDPNFCMAGTCYESCTLEDPDVVENAYKRIEVCTELDSCGAKGIAGLDYACKLTSNDQPHSYPLATIKMGDIRGPCGNTNCILAHKIKGYLRGLEAYKKATEGKDLPAKEENLKNKPCGQCTCKDERWHRSTCSDGGPQKKICPNCGGVAPSGETCKDKLDKLNTQNTNQVNYMVDVTLENPDLIESLFGPNFTVRTCQVQHSPSNGELKSVVKPIIKVCSSSLTTLSEPDPPYAQSSIRGCVFNIYNFDVSTSKGQTINNFCTDIPDDGECNCKPPKPTAPCKTFDCECLIKTQLKDTRKHHKPYCPSYKHIDKCPVIKSVEEEGAGEDEEEAPEALPYGLPPIQLGPCPVMGRPCTVPDGFARMYRVGSLPELPPSYSEAGKVCCSKEFERIKKVLKEYMITHKDNDYRCLNQWYMDTETRCCDKEQRLLTLVGKSCCGSHKVALNEKCEKEKKP